MDDKTQNNIPELENLPQAVQDLVSGGVWKERTEEIARKYSLNPTQTNTLVENTLLVLIGLDNPDSFLETAEELDISKLLAEQITEDLDARVFEYALKQTENKTPKDKVPAVITQVKKPENIPAKIPLVPEVRANPAPNMSRTVLDTKIPEIKPANLPMIETGEIAHDNSQHLVASSKETPMSKTVFDINTLLRQSASSSRISATSQEVVQQPVPVPRFTAVPLVKDNPAPVQKEIPKAQNMIDSKLTNVTVGMKEEVKIEKPQEKYTADPYREPIN